MCSTFVFADVLVDAAIVKLVVRLALDAATLGVHQKGNNETV